ncbi:hypothetical protein [Hymenobacter siberiensis]|uniref:hypothetical protein n=1 Tax=Hymenobacter siberiensis TaxID=2848396 RepID=UPI001D01F5D6|nr:hypothetical protein [Hymenobacter siberiensis]
MAKAQQLAPRGFGLFLCHALGGQASRNIGVDVIKLSLAQAGVLSERFAIHYPEHQSDKAQRTRDNESPLPANAFGDEEGPTGPKK